jgi:O-antigen/teichoic acid export membrane protein
VSLKKNVLANYMGQGVQALMGLAFIPFYIKYLGIEAYGLIGIFALLQAWLTLMDVGMKPALGREMARFTAGAHTAQSIRDLLRSVELIGISVAGVLALGIWAGSGWLASHWVTAKHLPLETVAQSFAVMGLVTALRFVEDIYASSLAGLQRQVLQNIVGSAMATARGVGAIAILAWISPSIKAFFLWQALISVTTTALNAAFVYRILPTTPIGASFSKSALVNVWRFAAGMVAITFLSLLLTQVDKILLSRLLTLESFGYYALAGVASSGLYSLTSPIIGAFSPRFTHLAASGDGFALRAVYHQGAQCVAVLTGSAAIVLVVFGARVLRLWTGNPALAQKVAPLMAVLALGTLFNGLMWIPYQVQLAHGWTSLTIKVNLVAVSLLIPAIVMIVPTYGAAGAARVWVTLNAGYLIFVIPLMHRSLLRGEKWRWYSRDTAIPLAAATATALLCDRLMPHGIGRFGEFSVLLLACACVLIAAALTAPLVRGQIALCLPSRIRSLAAGPASIT